MTYSHKPHSSISHPATVFLFRIKSFLHTKSYKTPLGRKMKNFPGAQPPDVRPLPSSDTTRTPPPATPLNGQTRTFQTMPVHVQLESCDSTFRCELHATTADPVTGNLQAVDWQVNGPQWRHLQTIPFPSVGKHTHVDVLIGVDHPGVHTSLAEVRGTTGEPIARLTPLGWTCIGQPSPTAKVCAFSGFAQTFFVQKQKHQDTELNHLVRQLWEVDGHSHLAPPRQLLTKPEALRGSPTSRAVMHSDRRPLPSHPAMERRRRTDIATRQLSDGATPA